MVANSRLGNGLGTPVTVLGTVAFIGVLLTCLASSLFQTNEKGQVVTKTALLKQMEELIEEPGLTCCICREGYKFQVKRNTFAKLSHEGWCVGSGRSGNVRFSSWDQKFQRRLGSGSVFPMKAGKNI